MKSELRVLELLKKYEEMDKVSVGKKLRIPPKTIELVLDHLEKEELISSEKDKIKITKKGIEKLNEYKSYR
ncbi:MAG: hypothetical protein ACE5K4_06370 [Candidatus Hydrothermarchaeota archaeon]